MKKAIMFFTLVLLIPIVIFAQEERMANVRNNWISGELSLIGGGASFERMINSHFSIGVYAYANIFIPLVPVNTGVGGNVRYYPNGRIFFLGLGMGYQGYLTIGAGGEGPGITPEIGWKIDVGEEGKFFIQPGIKLPLTFDMKLPYGVAPGIVPYFGLGYAF
jgi:hypothetical protein